MQHEHLKHLGQNENLKNANTVSQVTVIGEKQTQSRVQYFLELDFIPISFLNTKLDLNTLSQQECYHLLVALSSSLHQGGVALIIDLAKT